jgi:phytoene dehydrogenase-like protein
MDVIIPDNADQAKNILINKFPHEEKGIQKHFTSIFKIRDQLFRMPEDQTRQKLFSPLFPLLYPKVVFKMKKSVGEFMNSIIKDEILKLILLGNLLYYHDNPYTMSLLFFSIAQTSFLSGASYIQGVSHKLSDFLAEKIASNGGEILIRHLVTKIITENGKAIGVEYEQNTKKDVAETFIKRLDQVYPGIKGAVDYYEVGTAKTIERYTLNPGGSVYGFSQMPSQAGKNRLPHESVVENLYFASAWTQPGGGFGAVLGSGYMVANKILKREKS